MRSPGPVGRFSPADRLRKRKEFQAVQSRGQRVVTPHFVFLIRARGDQGPQGPARIGITASRKIGNAVTRNRFKRLVREAFRSTRTMWKPGIDVVVIVRRTSDELQLGQVVAEWERARPALASRGAAHREPPADGEPR